MVSMADKHNVQTKGLLNPRVATINKSIRISWKGSSETPSNWIW